MNASDLFKAGQLQPAIDAQVKEVKANPADHGKRVFLFELLAYAGDLDKAGRQIDAVQYGEMERDAAVLTYRKLLDAEKSRRRLFSDGLSPKFFGEQPEHVRLRLEAVNRLREHNQAEAHEVLEKANALVADLKGKLNDKPFSSLRDCDDLFAGVLEVVARGEYYWVPLDQVQVVALNPPKFPRDLLWRPARLDLLDGASGEVFLLTLYPGSHEHPDSAIKLGRSTDWKQAEGGPVLGVGLRTFLADDEAITLLEWQQLELAPPAEHGATPGGTSG
jgi:type VI secretion system protein ImpE